MRPALWRGAGGGEPGSPPANLHASTQTTPGTLEGCSPHRRRPRSTDAVIQRFSSSRAAPAPPRLGRLAHARARSKQPKRLLSPARPGCLRASWLRACPAAPSRPRQSGETQALTSVLAGERAAGPSEG